MAEFLLVVEGLMADGSDAAMMVSEQAYKSAMFGCAFVEPVHGYVWCDTHGWVLSDEACVCDACVEAAWEADFERLCEIEERAWLETERAAEWAVQQYVSQFGDDWPGEGDHGEMAYRCINRADPGYEPVYSSRFACGVCGQMTAYTEFDCPCCGASLF